MRALVTGATGMIGPALVNQLLAEKWTVRILIRREFDHTLFRAPLEHIYGDITNYDALLPVMRDVDVVFHLAAKLHLNNPSPSQSQEYHRINVNGAANVASAVVASGVKRMVHFSTIAVYGPSSDHEPFTESSPLNPQSLYADTKRKSEEKVLKVFQDSTGSSAVVLRLAAVYGPRLQGNYRSLVKMLRHGLFVPVGNGQNLRTMVYIDDLVRAAILTAEHPRAAGAIFNVTDGKIHTLNDVLAAIAGALGKSSPHFHLPYKPMKAMTTLADRLTQTLHLPAPKFTPLVDKMIENVAVSGEKICHDISFLPRYDIWHGWEKALAQT